MAPEAPTTIRHAGTCAFDCGTWVDRHETPLRNGMILAVIVLAGLALRWVLKKVKGS